MRLGGAVLGRHVLVKGAIGEVGRFAVELAVLSEAIVTAQVSGPARVAEALGAHRVVTDPNDNSLGQFQLGPNGVGGPG